MTKDKHQKICFFQINFSASWWFIVYSFYGIWTFRIVFLSLFSTVSWMANVKAYLNSLLLHLTRSYFKKHSIVTVIIFVDDRNNYKKYSAWKSLWNVTEDLLSSLLFNVSPNSYSLFFFCSFLLFCPFPCGS